MEKKRRDLKGFEPRFGEAKLESAAIPEKTTPRVFIFHAQAVDPHRLQIVVSDFYSRTFHCSLTVDQIEDLRDEIGVGGTWSEFVDYLSKSLLSDDVKILIDCKLGAMDAKLIAYKSKGMPHVTFSLDQILNTPSTDFIANLALELYKSLKEKVDDVIKERDANLQLTRTLSSIKEKNEDLQKQLDSFTFKNNRRGMILKSKVVDKAFNISENPISSDQVLLKSDSTQPSEFIHSKDSPSTKPSHCFARGRRKKFRGALFQDEEHHQTTG